MANHIRSLSECFLAEVASEGLFAGVGSERKKNRQ
jgi:hypothetical protein